MSAGNRRFIFAVIFSTAAFGAIDVDAQINSECTTLDQETGVCVPILTCSTITRVLEMAPKPLPASTVENVLKVHCGTFKNIPHVCCDRDGITNRSEINPTFRPSVASSEAEVQSGMAVLEAIQCGQNSLSFRDSIFSRTNIAGGKDSNLSEYPWMALLVYDDGLQRTMDCGGSLITQQYVLTAAHCIRTGLYKKLVSVRLGEQNINTAIDCVDTGIRKKCAPAIQEIDIEEAIYHKDYSPRKMSNDIGLIRLVSMAVFKSNVQPICLPIRENSKSVQLQQMIIAGWGRMDNGLKANILQKAVVPVQTNDYCQAIHKLFVFTDQHLCAGSANDIETCKGDSGGPIFVSTFYGSDVRWIQYGIVSAGSILCGSNYPGIYVRLTSYVEWIAANIKT